MLRDDKNKVIDMIINLRTKIGELVHDNHEDKVEKTQKYLNQIQDKVFGL